MLVTADPAVNSRPANAGHPGSILGSGGSPGERKWQPTAVFLPENPRDRGAWRATVHRAAKNQRRLRD